MLQFPDLTIKRNHVMETMSVNDLRPTVSLGISALKTNLSLASVA